MKQNQKKEKNKKIKKKAKKFTEKKLYIKMNCARLLGQRTRTRVYPLSNKSVMIIRLYYFQSTSYDNAWLSKLRNRCYSIMNV